MTEICRKSFISESIYWFFDFITNGAWATWDYVQYIWQQLPKLAKQKNLTITKKQSKFAWAFIFLMFLATLKTSIGSHSTGVCTIVKLAPANSGASFWMFSNFRAIGSPVTIKLVYLSLNDLCINCIFCNLITVKFWRQTLSTKWNWANWFA